MLDRLISTVMSLSIGAVGGAVFMLAHAPLPWTLGSITASALAAILGNRWPMPTAMRAVARPVVGVLAGSAFTPAIIGEAAGWWSPLLLLAAYSLIISVSGYLIFRKVVGLDPVTSYFAATPGGLGEFSLLGGALGGRMPTLILVHATRIVTIVFAVPVFLQLAFGYRTSGLLPVSATASHELADWLLLVAAGVAGLLVGRSRWFPGGPMVAAMLFSAAIHTLGITAASPPGWLVAIVQVLIGCVAGARFAGITWAEARLNVVVALLWSVVLFCSALLLAGIAAGPFGIPFEDLLLAVAPGGGNEMIIISYALQGDVAFVAFCQVLRVFLILAFAPLFFNFMARRQQSRDGKP